eukprot:398532_1
MNETKINIFGIESTLHDNSLFVPVANVEDLEWFEANYEPQNNDVFIVTYPKCGTTWTSKICYHIMQCLHQQQIKKNNTAHSFYSEKNIKMSHPIFSKPIFHLRSKSREIFQKYLKS